MLDAEADSLCQAGQYERSAERVSTLAGHYERNLQTQAGTVRLKMPKLRVPFETAIIGRYRRRESSVEEALVGIYLAGVSVRRVEDITEAGVTYNQYRHDDEMTILVAQQLIGNQGG